MTATKDYLSIPCREPMLSSCRRGSDRWSPMPGRSGRASLRLSGGSVTGVRRGGSRSEFGGHPERAAARMRWARRTVAVAFGASIWRESSARGAGQQLAGRAA
jgi:hypothetical protein